MKPPGYRTCLEIQWFEHRYERLEYDLMEISWHSSTLGRVESGWWLPLSQGRMGCSHSCNVNQISLGFMNVKLIWLCCFELLGGHRGIWHIVQGWLVIHFILSFVYVKQINIWLVSSFPFCLFYRLGCREWREERRNCRNDKRAWAAPTWGSWNWCHCCWYWSREGSSRGCKEGPCKGDLVLLRSLISPAVSKCFIVSWNFSI